MTMSDKINFLDETPFWVEITESRNIPRGAVIAGNYEGNPLYIGRALCKGSMTPGSVLLAADGELHCFVETAHTKANFEILVGSSSHNWIATSDGRIPDNAFSSGLHRNQESLFIGRAKDSNGNVIVGYVQPSRRVCYIPEIRSAAVQPELYPPQEASFNSFEILVV